MEGKGCNPYKGFEFDFAACKNSFDRFFFPSVQVSDKFSWSDLSDLEAGNLSIIGELKSDECSFLSVVDAIAVFEAGKSLTDKV